MTSAALLALAGCQDGGGLFKAEDGGATASSSAPASSVKLVDRDVEAPDVFQVTELGLWDGRPSLGGVWVAYPNVGDPERVIIRNPKNGKFVIGALFRRERDNPGPRLQISSDAAAALGALAGEPVMLNVTALRREEVANTPPDAKAPILDSNEPIATTKVDSVAATASAALANAEGKAAKAKPAKARPAKARPARASAASSEPAAKIAPAAANETFLQIGIFSVKANATRAADSLGKAGASVSVLKETSHGKIFWRVIAGPAGNSAARSALKAKAKGLGYTDAFFVKH